MSEALELFHTLNRLVQHDLESVTIPRNEQTVEPDAECC
jgi:hypothetical protein